MSYHSTKCNCRIHNRMTPTQYFEMLNSIHIENFGVDRVIVVYKIGCPPCNYLKEQIKGLDVELIESKDPRAQKYNPTAFPTIVFEDINGNIKATEIGARSRQEFENLVNKWKNKQTKNVIVVYKIGCPPCNYLKEQIKGLDVELIESKDPRAQKYNPTAFPTIIIEDNKGDILVKEIGAKSRHEFESFVAKYS